MKGNRVATSLSTKRFSENLWVFTKARNVLTDEPINDLSQLQLSAQTSLILELE